MTRILFISTLGILLGISCLTQNKNRVKDPKTMLCDPEKGACELPEQNTKTNPLESVKRGQKLKVVYFTDPICSSCWGIEPQLRKLKAAYGSYIDIDYHMGGLLPDWSYNSGGISKPSDVAVHWDEVSPLYDMPIDGDVWLEDPLDSSYPPSIAFKAAQMQDEKQAIVFLREIREMVFLRKKNITKAEHLEAAIEKVGLDLTRYRKDVVELAPNAFQEDLRLAQSYGVRGFPTLFFHGDQAEVVTVYGARSYEVYEAAVQQLMPESASHYDTDWAALFEVYSSWTAREYSEFSGLSRSKSVAQLEDLVDRGFVKRLDTKNGAIWIKK